MGIKDLPAHLKAHSPSRTKGKTNLLLVWSVALGNYSALPGHRRHKADNCPRHQVIHRQRRVGGWYQDHS